MQRCSFRSLALAVLLAGLLFVTLAPTAHAQLTLQLDQSAITVQQGGSFDITGGLLADPNNTDVVGGYSLFFTPVAPNVNSLTVIPVGAPADPTALTVDDAGFFTNFAGVSSSVPAGSGLFHFAVGSGAPVGEYTGDVTLTDANGGALTSAVFDLKINAVPEVGTLPLLAGMLLFGGLLLRRSGVSSSVLISRRKASNRAL